MSVTLEQFENIGVEALKSLGEIKDLDALEQFRIVITDRATKNFPTVKDHIVLECLYPQRILFKSLFEFHSSKYTIAVRDGVAVRNKKMLVGENLITCPSGSCYQSVRTLQFF